MKRDTRREILYYVITLVLVMLSVTFVYRLWEWNFLKIPFNYSAGDGTASLVATELLIREGGWGFFSKYFGAPFGQINYDGGQSSYLPSLVKKFFILFSDNPVLVLNLSYLAGFAIIACVSLAVLRKLKMNAGVAIVLSVLYACIPYHFMRGVAHYDLAFYAPVPIAVYYVVSVMRGDILSRENHCLNRTNVLWLLTMIMIGLNGVYYAFFTCFFLCVAAVYILINEKKLRRLRDVCLSILMITVTIIAGYLPTVLYTRFHGANTAGIIRVATGQEVYSLRLSQLILPITGHRLPILEKLKSIYNQSYSVNENDSASLGIFFTIAFIVLLLCLWKKKSQDKPYLRELACLNLAALLYASSGGLILIQGLISPLIRCGNRISVFIAFFACICLGVILTAFFENRKIPSRIIAVLMAVLLCIGILDNTKASYVDVETNRICMDSDRAFVENIEDLENGKGMIYQMPFMEYPESVPVVNLGDYLHSAGYLFSDTLRWSYGVFRGRTGSEIMKELGNTKMSEQLIRTIARMGYTGIYLDTRGFEEQKFNKLTKRIGRILEEDPLVSDLGDKYYYSLKNYIKENNIAVDYVAFEYTKGFYGQETDGNDTWRWVQADGEFMVYNFADSVQQGQLTMDAVPSQAGTYSLNVIGDEEASYEISETEHVCVMDVSLQPGANYFELKTDCPTLEGTELGRCLKLESLAFDQAGD